MLEVSKSSVERQESSSKKFEKENFRKQLKKLRGENMNSLPGNLHELKDEQAELSRIERDKQKLSDMLSHQQNTKSRLDQGIANIEAQVGDIERNIEKKIVKNLEEKLKRNQENLREQQKNFGQARVDSKQSSVKDNESIEEAQVDYRANIRDLLINALSTQMTLKQFTKMGVSRLFSENSWKEVNELKGQLKELEEQSKATQESMDRIVKRQEKVDREYQEQSQKVNELEKTLGSKVKDVASPAEIITQQSELLNQAIDDLNVQKGKIEDFYEKVKKNQPLIVNDGADNMDQFEERIEKERLPFIMEACSLLQAQYYTKEELPSEYQNCNRSYTEKEIDSKTDCDERVERALELFETCRTTQAKERKSFKSVEAIFDDLKKDHLELERLDEKTYLSAWKDDSRVKKLLNIVATWQIQVNLEKNLDEIIAVIKPNLVRTKDTYEEKIRKACPDQKVEDLMNDLKNVKESNPNVAKHLKIIKACNDGLGYANELEQEQLKIREDGVKRAEEGADLPKKVIAGVSEMVKFGDQVLGICAEFRSIKKSIDAYYEKVQKELQSHQDLHREFEKLSDVTQVAICVWTKSLMNMVEKSQQK